MNREEVLAAQRYYATLGRLRRGLPTLAEEDSGQLLSIVVQCLGEAPSGKMPDSREIVTMESGAGRPATSMKPSNLFLDLKKLVKLSASSTLTIVGSITTPWMVVLGGLVVIGDLVDALTASIPANSASIVWTLWKHGDADGLVRRAKLLGLVNRELSDCQRPRLTAGEFEDAWELLKKLGCVEEVQGKSGQARLRESVRV